MKKEVMVPGYEVVAKALAM
jgi:2-hydroxyacyl-CoA lyase 1